MICFTDWCGEIGIKLEPGQLVTCKVAFDGIDPIDLPPEERELARKIFGDVDRFTEDQRRVFVAPCGARAGKTRLFTAMRLLYLGLTCDLSELAPGETAFGMIVGPKKTHGKQALAYIKGVIRQIPALWNARVVWGAEHIEIARPGGNVAWIVAGASAKGDTQRGKSLFGASLEEAAFFKDEDSGLVNDKEIFDAIDPRIMPGGQILVPSTPWGEEGLLWDLYTENWGHPVDACAAHASTLVLRSDANIRKRVEALYKKNPSNAKREFGAEFMSMGAFAFFDKALVEAALSSEDYVPLPGDQLVAGGDLGFVKNSSGLALGVRKGPAKARALVVTKLIERIPVAGPLKPSETVKLFAAETKLFGAAGVMSDGHYRETMRETLDEYDLLVIPAPEGAAGKKDSYDRLRELFLEGRVVLPPGELTDRLVKQLTEVKAKPTAGGGMTFTSPTWTDGAHGDLVASVVNLAAQPWGTEVKAPPKVEDDATKREREHEERSARAMTSKKSLSSAWGRLLGK